jgi:pyruvyl transferase EpsO
MTAQQKISDLKQLIEEKLIPLITADYIFLDLPYHSNIGDTLIWEGEETFLKRLPYKCLNKSSLETFSFRELDKNEIILLHGGGNFGGLWRSHQNFRLNIIRQYPNNKIIVFPQSVYYDDEQLLKKDAAIMAEHKNFTICARDRMSYDILKKYFFNNILLVPDMAFFMDINRWNKYINPVTKGRTLFLDRKDCEKNTKENYGIVPPEAENHDWPTMEKTKRSILIFQIVQVILRKIDKVLQTNFNSIVSDFVYQKILRKYYIRTGISFLSAYSYIYTTRLHVAILSVLLEKEFTFFDNSYGKNRGGYETWLQDVDGIKFIGK